MKYKSLKSIFHSSGEQNWENEYYLRINHFTTYLTDIVINPIQNEVQQRHVKYPIFICSTKNIFIKSERILMNSNKINMLIKGQPKFATKAYLKNLLINELQSTNEKENVRSTKKELAAILNDISPQKSNKRFKGLVSQYALLLSDKNIEINDAEDFREVYDLLLSNDIEKKDIPDGSIFRNQGVGVHDNSRGKWLHRNEYKEYEIVDFINKLLQFTNYYEAPLLVKTMASHYLFEYLHPFYDGNGRLGRYMVAKQLSDNLDEVTALTFSYTVNRNKNKYDKAFEVTSNFYNKGDLTFFIDTMLDFILEGQQNAIEHLEDNIDMIDRLNSSLKKLKLNEEETMVLFVLLQDKVFGSEYSRLSLKRMVEGLPFGRKKLDSIIKKHEDKLILVKQRPTIYEIKQEFINELLSYNIDEE
ncbi:Fic family protein [Staphylococcus saprophyticus]|nr:Fic family protein [Staphylococcus saprophyticus]MDW3920835.1 Fic family protein [Staphylococcus saprophyticus]MDW3948343.1 Fic family protein [Staphylococcus saprophyticus]MDW3953365.1 Fic family protein [Staphylococcus saprophyticus]